MRITDAQVHVWAPNSEDRPWPTDEPPLSHPIDSQSAADLIMKMDAAGVDRAVLVPPRWAGLRNDVAVEAARRWPDRLAVMGRLDLRAAGGIDRIPALMEEPGMRGLRFSFVRQSDFDDLPNAGAERLWSAAAKLFVPVCVYAPGRLDIISQAARSHPALKIAVDHLNLPRGRSVETAESELRQLAELASLPNVSVKATALPCHAADPYPYPSLRPVVRRMIDAYGPSRVFWGTDLTRLPCTYSEAVSLFIEHLGLSDAELPLVMGEAMLDWLGWT